jgi:hypothetical protein
VAAVEHFSCNRVRPLAGSSLLGFRVKLKSIANWAVRDNTQVPNNSFNEFVPIKKVAMQALDERKQRA